MRPKHPNPRAAKLHRRPRVRPDTPGSASVARRIAACTFAARAARGLSASDLVIAQGGADFVAQGGADFVAQGGADFVAQGDVDLVAQGSVAQPFCVARAGAGRGE